MAVFHALASTRTVNWLQRYAVGTTMPNLNVTIVSKIPVTFPDKEKLPKLLKALELQQQNLKLAKDHLEHLQNLKVALLNNLLE
jgi:type I restriction enzyme, S subunit